MRTRFAAVLALLSVTACGIATDPATRLAANIEDGAGRLRDQNGATDSIHHATPPARHSSSTWSGAAGAPSSRTRVEEAR